MLSTKSIILFIYLLLGGNHLLAQNEWREETFDDFIDGSFGVYPTKRMQQHIELTGIITDDDQVVRDAVLNDTADQGAFGGNSFVMFFDNIVLF